MRLIFIGEGFLPGVPARDLTEEETALFGGAAALVATGLYEEVKAPKPAAGKQAAQDGE